MKYGRYYGLANILQMKLISAYPKILKSQSPNGLEQFDPSKIIAANDTAIIMWKSTWKEMIDDN